MPHTAPHTLTKARAVPTSTKSAKPPAYIPNFNSEQDVTNLNARRADHLWGCGWRYEMQRWTTPAAAERRAMVTFPIAVPLALVTKTPLQWVPAN